MQQQAQIGLSTRHIAISGVLAAIAIFLGLTRLVFIPNPFTGVNATVGHIPPIIGGILEGPIVGAIIGTIFGLSSYFYATIPVFKDPLVAIVPRIFIGVFSAWTYMAFRKAGEWWAIALAAVIGTATNTVLVVGLAVVRGFWTKRVGLGIAITHGIPEMIAAVIICLAVLLSWKRVQTGRARARV